MIGNIILLTVLLAGVNCRYLVEEPGYYGIDEEHFPLEEIQFEPVYNRVRRQAQTTLAIDGKTGNPTLSAKLPVVGNDQNRLSVITSHAADSRSVGLALDNVNGHGLTLSQKTIPEFGKQLTAAGNLNLLNTDKHNVNANAFVTQNQPKFPDVPNFNTYGGGVDYTFNNKIGASLNAARTDFLQRTDVNALGHLNLFRNKDSSIDFNAGASRSFSPFIPKSSWQPTYGFSFSKSW